jgi:very-short-patch-repair endonuclease
MLAAFEAKHGPVTCKRTTGPVKTKPARPSASDEFGARLRSDPRLHGAELVGEFVFHPQRKWRFDWCFLGPKLAIEIEGFGRHQTYTGYRGDCEKYNAAVLHGWRVLRFVAGERDHMADWVDTTIRALCGLDDL